MLTCISRPTEDLQQLQNRAHTAVLIADSRLDQVRTRAAVDVVFSKHVVLGSKFEPFCGQWTSWPAGGWTWAVEPPGSAVAEVIARRRARFDMRIGRLFAVSLIPGATDRLVLIASQLCLDEAYWRDVVDDMLRTITEQTHLGARRSARV